MTRIEATAPGRDPRQEPQSPEPEPRFWRLARAMVVVSGGPVSMAVAGAMGPVAWVRRWPDRASEGRRRGLWVATVLGTVAPWVYGGFLRPWLKSWGSTAEERDRRYPGDTADAWFTTTRAVTVDAPADEVWRWLVQIGQDRGGFYSYDWLENLAGCRLDSAAEIREEWQTLLAGDPLVLFPGFATRIAAVDPPRSLVIENWGAYVVEPLGRGRSRLVARSHADRGVAGAAYVLLIELPHAIMERRMLLGIRERAEGSWKRHRS